MLFAQWFMSPSLLVTGFHVHVPSNNTWMMLLVTFHSKCAQIQWNQISANCRNASRMRTHFGLPSPCWVKMLLAAQATDSLFASSALQPCLQDMQEANSGAARYHDISGNFKSKTECYSKCFSGTIPTCYEKLSTAGGSVLNWKQMTSVQWGHTGPSRSFCIEHEVSNFYPTLQEMLSLIRLASLWH